MQKSTELQSHLKRGSVYKRYELEQWSNAVDRHLTELVGAGILIKVGPGMYYYPKKNAFGIEPPTDQMLVEKFLDNTNFLITSYNYYNALGLGTTQLYNKNIVYNHQRSGEIRLNNKLFDFRKKSAFPSKHSEEFLLVDLLNNLENLAEDPVAVLEKAKRKVEDMDPKKLADMARKYASPKVRKLLASAA